MTFQDHAFNTAYQMGAYQSIATMFAEAVRELEAADNKYMREFALRRLSMLATQLEETKEKFEKEVDTAA